MITLRHYQQNIVNDIYERWNASYRNVLAVLPTGAGKCLGKGTPILMFDGTIKAVENVRVGDLLMGPDSKPRRVLSLARGQEQMYRVIPVKGDPYVVNESHILSLKQTGLKSDPKYPCQKGKGEIVNISVKDYLQKSKYFKHVHKGWRAPVSWGEKQYSATLPPYLLGVWLGDGTSVNASITTADREIEDYVNNFAKITNQQIRKNLQPGNASSVYHLTANWRRKGTTLSDLKSLNLIQNKHIPHVYKTGSDQQRLELLAGLLDSDGHLHHGCYDVVFKSKTLAEDTIFVARSLGFSAYMKTCFKTCTNTGARGCYYRFRINGDLDKIPTKLTRHNPPPRRQKKSVLVTGIKVEPLTVDDYYGFTIDGDHLFMLGDFTVTHNTVVFCHVVNEHMQLGGRPSIFAHRSFLLYQISKSLAEQGVYHKLHASAKDINICGALHTRKFGRSYIRQDAPVTVTSVDKFYRDIRNENSKSHYAAKELARLTTLWVTDEAHHLLETNKWGSVPNHMPHALGLGVTATPRRADGWGLGADASKGVFHAMCVGVNMSQLIAWGNLTDYDLFEPPVGGRDGIDLEGVGKNVHGDYIESQLVTRVDKREIHGDVVKHYLAYGKGKLCVVFGVNIEHCEHLEEAYRAQGVKAKALSSKNTPTEREEVIDKFSRHEYEVLINCDLFGEGFDLPAIEMVQMVRPTESWALFVQQFGRALRPMAGKSKAIILDHVGNWRIHGLPDQPQTYSLDDRDRRASKSTEEDQEVPLTRCPNCNKIYRVDQPVCPHCGHSPTATTNSKGSVKTVAGDLIQVDPNYIASLRGTDFDIDDAHVLARHQRDISEPNLLQSASDKFAFMQNPIIQKSAENKHKFWQSYQERVRPLLTEWLTWHQNANINKAGAQAIFLRKFGIDVYTAQVQKPKDDNGFEEKLMMDLDIIRSTGGVKYV